LLFGLAAGFFNVWEDHQYWWNGAQHRWYAGFAILGEPGNEMANSYGGDWQADEAWLYAPDITFWNGLFWMIVAIIAMLVLHWLPSPNDTPAPNRRRRFPLGILNGLVHHFCARPASPAAVGEARRWACL
jgi:hypothetical protein